MAAGDGAAPLRGDRRAGRTRITRALRGAARPAVAAYSPTVIVICVYAGCEPPAAGLCPSTAPRRLASFSYSVLTVNFASRSAARAAAACSPTTSGTCCDGRLEPVATERRTTL